MGVLYAAPKTNTTTTNTTTTNTTTTNTTTTNTTTTSAFDWLGRQFKKIGFARGTVWVDGDQLIRLEITPDACEDISPLADLPIDAIDALHFKMNADVRGQFETIGKLTGLRYLGFRGCPITDGEFEHLANLRNLEELYCSGYGYKEKGLGLTDASLDSIAKFPNLRRLSLRDNPISDDGLVTLANYKSLESLELIGTDVTGTGIDSLLMLPKLTKLRFGAYESGAPIDDEGMQSIGMMTQLVDLDLSGTKITDDGLAHITRLENLEDLRLDYTDITDDGLRYLKDLDKLRTLGCQKKRGQSLGDLAAEHLAKLQSLESISGNWNLSDVGLLHLAECQALKSIDFDGGINDENIEFVAKIISLEDLGLQNCQLTDRGIAKLTALKRLQHFSIHTNRVTTACLTSLSQLPELKTLRLDLGNGRTRPVELGDDWRSLKQMKQLERLYLDGIQLREADLPALGELINLELLWIETRNQVLSASLFDAVAKLNKLKNLKVRAVMTSDEHVRKLTGLTELERIDLRSTLTDQQLMMLANLPNLQYLTLSAEQNVGSLTRAGMEMFREKSNATLRIPFRKPFED